MDESRGGISPFLAESREGINKENWTAMLWEVRHKWPSGAQFAFNCYHHWYNLMIQDGVGGGDITPTTVNIG